jgi:hypothetical protein
VGIPEVIGATIGATGPPAGDKGETPRPALSSTGDDFQDAHRRHQDHAASPDGTVTEGSDGCRAVKAFQATAEKQTVTRDATPLRTVTPSVPKSATAAGWAESENTNYFNVSDTVRNGSVTPLVRLEVTITTIQMSALAGRLSDGCVTRDDLDLAARLVMAFAGQYPRDGVVRLVDGGISDDLADDDEEAAPWPSLTSASASACSASTPRPTHCAARSR